MEKYPGYSDQQLVILLKQGSQEAYTAIYERYKALLYRHAFKKLGDQEEARDVVQDVFLTLWNRKETIQEDNNLSGYLYTAVRNKALNIFAQKKVRDSYEESLLRFANEHTIVTDHLVRERQMSELIEKEITAIPEKMREIFILSRKSYLKNKDIAELLGVSEHTVATQIKRALKVLRLRIGLLVFLALYFMR